MFVVNCLIFPSVNSDENSEDDYIEFTLLLHCKLEIKKNARVFDFSGVFKFFNWVFGFTFFLSGYIVQDKITPKERFGKYFKNDTKWQSMSMGKSIISYIAGHAICRGYISGINEILDWDIFDNTLYEGQKFINVLNMASGSKKIYGYFWI
jgi:hypothetical protein